MIRILAVLVLAGSFAQAQSLLETFGIGANQFQIEFVTIGNPGNSADTTGNPNPSGSVAYIYNLGKYEISRDMVSKANLLGSLGITLQDMTSYGGNGANKPATGISWYEAAKFVNWLNTSTGSKAAYKFDGSGNYQLWSSGDVGYQAGNPFRNSLAKYWLPSKDEWYKGAYGSPNGSWYNYETGSDTQPTSVTGGTSPGTAVYWGNFIPGPADITNAGGLSAYGTMAQAGNAWEWTESAWDMANDTAGELRELRGGAWYNLSDTFGAENRFGYGAPTVETESYGFRIASVPESSSFSLLLASGVALIIGRRKRF